MTYYLGIDGGGTKTYALLCDEHGTVLGKGRSGNGNHQTGALEAANSIREATFGALDEAGLRLEDIQHTYLGLAGADREADYLILHPMIREIGFINYTINCDTMIGCRDDSPLWSCTNLRHRHQFGRQKHARRALSVWWL